MSNIRDGYFAITDEGVIYKGVVGPGMSTGETPDEVC
jgi:hypothetical protein